jgi:spore coat polysaccharide biosynthesis protein SpsF
MTYKTDQENFWANDFGSDYIRRNKGADTVASNTALFAHAFRRIRKLESVIELGANIGLNLRAIRTLFPKAVLSAVEINARAVKELEDHISKDNDPCWGGVYHSSILEWQPPATYDLALIKGVLIHINPDHLPEVYDRLYACTNQYILVAEYYNPSPVAVSYRGHTDRLFKRDFAGEMMDRYQDLHLLDYGFVYHRDPVWPQDDITWFLMEKS